MAEKMTNEQAKFFHKGYIFGNKVAYKMVNIIVSQYKEGLLDEKLLIQQLDSIIWRYGSIGDKNEVK